MNVVKEKSTWPGSLYGFYIASVGSVLLGTLFIRIGAESGWLARPVAIALAVLVVVPMFVTAGLFWRLLKSDLDEMLQRIVLEGIAFAVVIILPLAALYASLHAAKVHVPKLDLPDIVMTPALLIALGVAIAWRRVNK